MGRNLWVKQLREEDGDLLTHDEADLVSGKCDKENHAPQTREPRVINIGGKATTFMGKGDRLIIETPGGGAWGAEEEFAECDESLVVRAKHALEWAARGSLAERAAQQAGFGGF